MLILCSSTRFRWQRFASFFTLAAGHSFLFFSAFRSCFFLPPHIYNKGWRHLGQHFHITSFLPLTMKLSSLARLALKKKEIKKDQARFYPNSSQDPTYLYHPISIQICFNSF